MTARSPSTSTCSTAKRIEGSVASPCQPAGTRRSPSRSCRPVLDRCPPYAVVGDEIDEVLGCPLEEGGVVLVDDIRGVVHSVIHGLILRSRRSRAIPRREWPTA